MYPSLPCVQRAFMSISCDGCSLAEDAEKYLPRRKGGKEVFIPVTLHHRGRRGHRGTRVDAAPRGGADRAKRKPGYESSKCHLRLVSRIFFARSRRPAPQAVRVDSRILLSSVPQRYIVFLCVLCVLCGGAVKIAVSAKRDHH